MDMGGESERLRASPFRIPDSNINEIQQASIPDSPTVPRPNSPTVNWPV